MEHPGTDKQIQGSSAVVPILGRVGMIVSCVATRYSQRMIKGFRHNISIGNEEIERRNLEADESWEEYRRSGKGVSDETMTAWLDSWGADKEGPCPAPERLC